MANNFDLAVKGSATQSVYLEERDILIVGNQEHQPTSFSIFAHQPSAIVEQNAAAVFAWLREHGLGDVTEKDDWMPLEFVHGAANVASLQKYVADMLPDACYRFLLAQACAAENVFANRNTGQLVVVYHGTVYTPDQIAQRWESGEIHP